MSVKVFYATRLRQVSEVVKVELHPDFSRESGTAKAGVAIDLGSILGKLTTPGADFGRLVLFNAAGADGSQTIEGVSQVVIEAGTDPVDGVVYSARGSVLALSGLRGLDGLTADQLGDVMADLRALGLVVRQF